jgi:hypothetical protein
VVARSEPIARALVRRAAEASTRVVGIDSFDGRPEWEEWLRGRGFAAERPLLRMRREPVDGSGAQYVSGSTSFSSLHAFAILGPEFG